ncbi:ester cyclase [Microbispora sp. H11081]|uniref:ester cyclase n=1 Tax=Microbispora sp. H11081 TaxID=2729107 RepID=UPI0014753B2B|nr:ester cyclase [Microbispora sp. H11081]
MSDPWQVKRQLTDALNEHDLEAVLETFAPDAVLVSPFGVAEGHEQIGWMYEQVFKSFPDFHLVAWYEAVTCHTPLMVEWTVTGTHLGPLLLPDGRELAATGRPVTFRGTCASFIEDGKIKTHREYFDQLEVYSQLGLRLAEPVG